MPDGVIASVVIPTDIPVNADPSPTKEVAVQIPVTRRPSLNVPTPIESTFFTSSYVNTPATFKLPVTSKLSSTIVAPVAESNTKLPEDVLISLSASIPNLRLSI